MENGKLFLTRKEIAKALGVSLPTIQRRLSDGSIPHVALGSRILIPASYLDVLVASAIANSVSEDSK